MIKHLFKLMWNRKKQNLLLMTEILISFFVMFSIFTLSIYYFSAYQRPMGFEYKNVWAIKYSYNTAMDTNFRGPSLIALKNTLKSLQEIREVSFSGTNFPFSMDSYQSGVSYENKMVPSVNRYMGDEHYSKLLDIKLLEGKWFTEKDRNPDIVPIVINQVLREKLFGTEKAVGRILGHSSKSETKMKVIGVIPDIKDRGNYQSREPSLYKIVDTAASKSGLIMLVKVSQDANAGFQQKLFKLLANNIKGSSVEIELLEDARADANKLTLVPMIILTVVAAFLLINVALGLFGVLWQNISRRRSEIGLRRSIGAYSNQIYAQIIFEAVILVSLALIPGAIITSQLAIFDVVQITPFIYLNSFLITALLIYFVVIVCALYPANMAARVTPSEALHEE